MGCAEYQRWLSPYLDGRLEASQRGQLEAHLNTCAGCARARDSLKTVQTLLRGLGEVEVPKDLLGGVHEKLSTQPRWKRWVVWQPLARPRHSVAIVMTAVFVMVVIGVPWSLRRGGQPHLKKAVGSLSRATPQPLPNAIPLREAEKVAGSGRALIAEDGFASPPRPVPTTRQVRWHVKDPREAPLQVVEWVRARGGSILSMTDRHLELRLASADAPAFLQQFSDAAQLSAESTARENTPEQGNLPTAMDSPAQSRASQESQHPLWVTISLELVPTE